MRVVERGGPGAKHPSYPSAIYLWFQYASVSPPVHGIPLAFADKNRMLIFLNRPKIKLSCDTDLEIKYQLPRILCCHSPPCVNIRILQVTKARPFPFRSKKRRGSVG